MNADGTNKHVLYDAEPNNPHVPPLAGRNAQWSPDGTQIVFDLCPLCSTQTNNTIYLFDIKTKTLTQLTDHPANELYPTWGANGSRIAFISNRKYVNVDSKTGRKDLYVIDVDIRKLTRLTKTGNATRPAWSPDGSKIAYEWNIHGNEIFIYEMDGGKITRIETRLQFAANPLWNNNGTQLLVFGRETEQSNLEMRLLSLANDSCNIMQTVPLDKANTRYYDWYIKK